MRRVPRRRRPAVVVPEGNPLRDGDPHAKDAVALVEDIEDDSEVDEPAEAGPEPAEPPGVREGGAYDYRAWQGGPLRRATDTSIPDVVSALVEIVESEGPMTAFRACRLYVKAAGGQRIGKHDRVALHKALRQGARQGLLVIRNERGSRDLDEHIVRKAGTPLISVRHRGPRQFSDVPPSEVAAVFRDLRSRNPGSDQNAIYRDVLSFYETRRLTTNIEERLGWISTQEALLLDEENSPAADLGAP